MSSEGKKIGFFARVLGKWFGKATDSAVMKLAEYDPDTAVEVGREQLEKELEDASRELARARQEYAKEQREAVAAQKRYDDDLAVAEALQQRLNAEQNPTRRQEIEQALNQLVEQLELFKIELDRELAEAADAKQILDMIEEGVKERADQIRSVSQQLEGNKRRMKAAKSEKDRAQRRAEHQQIAAGLKQPTKLNTAMAAIQQVTERYELEAETAKTQAQLLGAPSSTQNQLIAEARASVSGKQLGSTSDRLARLKGGSAPAALPAPEPANVG